MSLARRWGAGHRADAGDPSLAPGRQYVHADRVHFGYVEGGDVLRKVTLEVAPARGSPWSAPPVPASPRWAGCWPASTGPRDGRSPRAARSCPDVRRTGPSHVALVNQEHHVFGAPCATTSGLARPAPPTPSCGRRWARSTRTTGPALDEGLDTEVGSGGLRYPRPGPSRSRWPVSLADPHTLVLTADVPARPASRTPPSNGPRPGSWTAARWSRSPTARTPPMTRTSSPSSSRAGSASWEATTSSSRRTAPTRRCGGRGTGDPADPRWHPGRYPDGADLGPVGLGRGRCTRSEVRPTRPGRSVRPGSGTVVPPVG